MRLLLSIIFLAFTISLSAQVNVAGYIQTIGGGTYPTHMDSLARGGFRPVADTIERNNIPALRRKVGMFVFVNSNNLLYRLSALPNTWVVFSTDLSPYLLKTDTTAFLANYASTPGWGLLKSTKTLRIDSTLAASRAYVRTSITNLNLGATYYNKTGGYLIGTGGAGFFGMLSQSANPSTGAGLMALFANSSNVFSVKNGAGLTYSFPHSNTADRAYTLPDASGTIALTSNLSSYFPVAGGSLTGTGGAGFFGMLNQSAAPTTVTGGLALYANASNALSIKDASGFVYGFSESNTADRLYTLQNATGTIPLLQSTQTWSGVNNFTGFTGFNQASPLAQVHITPSYSSTGDQSGNGFGFRLDAATYNNSTTAASGTVINGSAASIGIPTITSTNTGVVYTDFASLRIAGAPIASTNTTITNTWALHVASGAVNIAGGNLFLSNSTGTSYIPRMVVDNTLANGSGSFMIRNVTGIVNNGIERVPGNNQPVEFYQRGSGANAYMWRFSATDNNSRPMSNATYNAVVQIDNGFGTPASTGYQGSVLYLTPNINVASSSGTIVRGIHYNPTLTSLAGVSSHRAIETTTGDVLLGTISGNVSIGATTTLASSAILQVVSTTQGFLPPVMTTTNRNAISSPAAGLEVYDNTINAPHYYNGSSWKQVADGRIFRSGATTVNFSTPISAGSNATLTFTLTGILTSDVIMFNHSAALNAGCNISVRISAADTIEVTYINGQTSGSVTPGSETYYFTVYR